jgi:hypothetical protein
MFLLLWLSGLVINQLFEWWPKCPDDLLDNNSREGTVQIGPVLAKKHGAQPVA